MLLIIIGILLFVFGLLIRKEYFNLNLPVRVHNNKSAWIGINVIIISAIVIFYGIMFKLDKTDVISHLMFIIVIIVFIIRIFYGSRKEKGQQ